MRCNMQGDGQTHFILPPPLSFLITHALAHTHADSDLKHIAGDFGNLVFL